LSLLPIPPVLFLSMLYLEAAGKLGIAFRRIGSGMAAGLMLLAIGWSAALMFPSMFPHAGMRPASWRALFGWASWGLNTALFLTWTLLMGLFAARRSPLCDRITARAASFLAVLSAVLVCAVVGSIALRTGLRLSHPVADAIQIAAPVLILIFAASIRHAAPPYRQNAR
jgi:hypothetical protein